MPSRAAVRRDTSQGGGGVHSGAMGDDDNAARRPSGNRAAGCMIHGTRPGPVTRLLHLGNVVVDMVLYVPALPEPGGDVLATGAQTAAGGGFNVMAAAARQGLAVAYGGVIGTGPFAALARAACAAEGVEVLQPAKPGLDTGFVVSVVDATGERTFLTS